MRSIEDIATWMRSGAIPPQVDGLPDDDEYARFAQALARAFVLEPAALEAILRLSVCLPPVDYRLAHGGPFENYALQREGANRLAALILKCRDDGEALTRSPQAHASAPLPADERPADPAFAGGGDGIASPDFRVG